MCVIAVNPCPDVFSASSSITALKPPSFLNTYHHKFDMKRCDPSRQRVSFSDPLFSFLDVIMNIPVHVNVHPHMYMYVCVYVCDES